MVDSDGKAIGRIGMEAQLDPVARVVRVNAADLDAPRAAGRFQLGAVQVDKKLVSVGNAGRDASGQADFSNHAPRLCKSGASENSVIVEVCFVSRNLDHDIRYCDQENSLQLAGEVFGSAGRY